MFGFQTPLQSGSWLSFAQSSSVGALFNEESPEAPDGAERRSHASVTTNASAATERRDRVFAHAFWARTTWPRTMGGLMGGAPGKAKTFVSYHRPV
jgi:hypothetical protein